MTETPEPTAARGKQQAGNPKMKLFIGWSGERSKAIALALRQWIPMVLQHVDPWMSETDIAAGARWHDIIATKLEEANFGVICLTPENVAEPWILFEAGAMSKFVQQSLVIPLLHELDFSDISGPLGDFQSKKLHKEGVSGVMKSINDWGTNGIDPDTLQRCFETYWSILEDAIGSIKETTVNVKTRQVGDILEELVSLVRSTRSHVRIMDATLRRSAEEQAENEAAKRVLKIADQHGIGVVKPTQLTFGEPRPPMTELEVETFNEFMNSLRHHASGGD